MTRREDLRQVRSLGWLRRNGKNKADREYAEKWPNINKMGTPPPDSDEWKDVKGKFEKHFSPKPGKGS